MRRENGCVGRGSGGLEFEEVERRGKGKGKDSRTSVLCRLID